MIDNFFDQFTFHITRSRENPERSTCTLSLSLYVQHIIDNDMIDQAKEHIFSLLYAKLVQTLYGDVLNEIQKKAVNAQQISINHNNHELNELLSDIFDTANHALYSFDKFKNYLEKKNG